MCLPNECVIHLALITSRPSRPGQDANRAKSRCACACVGRSMVALLECQTPSVLDGVLDGHDDTGLLVDGALVVSAAVIVHFGSRTGRQNIERTLRSGAHGPDFDVAILGEFLG